MLRPPRLPGPLRPALRRAPGHTVYRETCVVTSPICMYIYSERETRDLTALRAALNVHQTMVCTLGGVFTPGTKLRYMGCENSTDTAFTQAVVRARSGAVDLGTS